ncbi:hypothetical protein [Rhizobium sp. 18055]|uniref:hypothetical protein n=1 Tax=Rhizobium sp. 18055 TaxID=2681403 RepID=UPI001358ACA1|nr:hypothetical protein [Rhizobium sp. 18055]
MAAPQRARRFSPAGGAAGDLGRSSAVDLKAFFVGVTRGRTGNGRLRNRNRYGRRFAVCSCCHLKMNLRKGCRTAASILRQHCLLILIITVKFESLTECIFVFQGVGAGCGYLPDACNRKAINRCGGIAGWFDIKALRKSLSKLDDLELTP